MHGIQSRRRTARPRTTSWCYSPHPVRGQVWAGSQSLKHTAAITTRWSLVAHLRFYDDACAIILALGYFLCLEEQKSQLECFASTASACGVRGLWKMG